MMCVLYVCNISRRWAIYTILYKRQGSFYTVFYSQPVAIRKIKTNKCSTIAKKSGKTAARRADNSPRRFLKTNMAKMGFDWQGAFANLTDNAEAADFLARIPLRIVRLQRTQRSTEFERVFVRKLSADFSNFFFSHILESSKFQNRLKNCLVRAALLRVPAHRAGVKSVTRDQKRRETVSSIILLLFHESKTLIWLFRALLLVACNALTHILCAITHNKFHIFAFMLLHKDWKKRLFVHFDAVLADVRKLSLSHENLKIMK